MYIEFGCFPHFIKYQVSVNSCHQINFELVVSKDIFTLPNPLIAKKELCLRIS